MQEGKRIYVESLQTDEEYKQSSRKNPSVYNSPTKPPYFKSEFDWRKGMGNGFTEDEIKKFNDTLDYIKSNAEIAV